MNLDDLPKLRTFTPPRALRQKTLEAATRAASTPWSRRMPDIALAAYCVIEMIYALRVVHVLP